MEERRRYRRWEDRRIILYRKQNGEKREATLLDISLGGMRLLLDKPLEIDTVLEGEFKILPEHEPFFIKGEVVWLREIFKEDRKYFTVGIKFSKISTLPLE